MEDRFAFFTELILNISRCISKIKNAEMGNLNLKGNQVQCLFNLHQSGGASLTALAQLCKEDKGAMSRTINQLQANGLVYCEEKDNQKYRNQIKLTPKGTKVSNVIVEKIENLVQLCGKDIEDEERVNFYKTLKKISDNLTNCCNLYGE